MQFRTLAATVLAAATLAAAELKITVPGANDWWGEWPCIRGEECLVLTMYFH